jgi:hypothetical protein
MTDILAVVTAIWLTALGLLVIGYILELEKWFIKAMAVISIVSGVSWSLAITWTFCV